jgi:hypothetical protein
MTISRSWANSIFSLYLIFCLGLLVVGFLTSL